LYLLKTKLKLFLLPFTFLHKINNNNNKDTYEAKLDYRKLLIG